MFTVDSAFLLQMLVVGASVNLDVAILRSFNGLYYYVYTYFYTYIFIFILIFVHVTYIIKLQLYKTEIFA